MQDNSNEKIVNLNEDANSHEHDSSGFEKLKRQQNKTEPVIRETKED